MNIIACSYTNLGPFANTTVSLVIHPGAAMIIAPVGTGKSMLFFDGPVYGLYKYSTRDVLNNACTTGSVSLLVEIYGEYWLIRRQLKASKTRSISTISSLARYHGDVSHVYINYPDIVYCDRDIIAELDSSAIDEIVFKNETDLQKHFEEFLPPRDVFMNRDMMMQESANIFDLTQSERIGVFKHLFGLLDIDAAKDRLSDEKTRLKYLLQAKKDTSVMTSKFHQMIQGLRKSWTSLSEYDVVDLSHYDGQIIEQWLADSNILGTTVALDQVSLIDRKQGEVIRTLLEGRKQEYHQSQAQLGQITNHKSQIKKELETLATRNSQLTTQITQYNTILSTYNQEQLHHLKAQKLELIQLINESEFAINYDVFGSEIEDLQQAYDYVMHLTQQGKELSLKQSHLVTQIKGVKDMQQLQIANQKSQLVALDQQIKQLEEQIKIKKERISVATKFYCIKIEANCPFVEQISGSIITTHERELEQITNHKLQIMTQKQQLLDTPTTDYSAHLQRLTQEQSELDTELQQLRSRLVAVGYKQIMDLYPQYQQHQSKLKAIDQQISEYESKLQEIEQITNDKIQIEIELKHIQAQSSKLKTESEQLEQELNQFAIRHSSLETKYQHITAYEGQLQTMIDQITRINELISDYKLYQQEIVMLEQRAKQVDELYAIVSKELTVLVLQEYLPVLSDMINNQLAKVVDYRLDFTVNNAGDKLEIMIIDHYGSREVKSLSGGQRAVLRLCWILAIALWSGNKFLFLDETINHLDKEMVSKVAELIEEFVQGNKVKLYAITHSEQIQNLDIWDHVVKINSLLSK